MPTSKFPELGFYTLAGHTRTPADMLDEVQYAEKLGIGSAWISERFDVKEAAVLAGAAGAVTKDINICTAATNVNTRHPVVSAGIGSTMSRLTDEIGAECSPGAMRAGLADLMKEMEVTYGRDPLLGMALERMGLDLPDRWDQGRFIRFMAPYLEAEHAPLVTKLRSIAQGQ